MSISTNIDGSVGGTSQLLDLLSLVSNPAVYEAKVKALQNATEEHNKALALVAPASEILAIRKQIDQDKIEVKAELEKAREDAAKLVADAKAEAKGILDNAKEQGSKTAATAKNVEKQAADKLAAAVEAERKVTEALAEAKALQKSLDDKIKATDALRAEVEKLKVEHEAAKAALIAKHKRHLQELEL